MADDNIQTWHWRNTMKPARFFHFDARVSYFLLLVLLHARLWTLELMLAVGCIFWILERKGLFFAAALRALRVWFIGKYRPAWIFSRRRKMLDTGSY
jgi:intracellular multiplication protein IcmT